MARPANIRRENIIEVARPMFYKKGIAATEMKDIAAACGIGRSSLYRYFDCKESLALAIAGEILETLMDTLDAGIPTSGTGYSAVAAGLSAFVRAMKENVHLVRFLDDFDSYFTGGYPALPAADLYRDQVHMQNDTLAAALRRGADDGSLHIVKDVAFTARFLTNALLGVCQRVLPRAGILRQEQGYSVEYIDATLDALMVRLRRQEPPTNTGENTD